MSHGDADSPEVPRSQVWSIVVAGCSQLRYGSRKQFVDLGGRSVLQRSVDAAATASSGVVVVVPADAVADQSLTAPNTSVVVVAGGSTRTESVRAGLHVVPDVARHVLVHDAARPLASPTLFSAVCSALADGAFAVVPVVSVTDTIRWRQGGTVDCTELFAVQTPQGFDAATLRRAHSVGGDATDDATLVEALGFEVILVDGEPHNRKLTDPDDLATAEAMISILEERR